MYQISIAEITWYTSSDLSEFRFNYTKGKNDVANKSNKSSIKNRNELENFVYWLLRSVTAVLGRLLSNWVHFYAIHLTL